MTTETREEMLDLLYRLADIVQNLHTELPASLERKVELDLQLFKDEIMVRRGK